MYKRTTKTLKTFDDCTSINLTNNMTALNYKLRKEKKDYILKSYYVNK